MISRLTYLSVLAALHGPAWSQPGPQVDDAQRLQRRIELRHAIEAQRVDMQRPPGPPMEPVHSLSAEQRAQLREDLRRQSPPFSRPDMPPPPPGRPGARERP